MGWYKLVDGDLREPDGLSFCRQANFREFAIRATRQSSERAFVDQDEPSTGFLFDDGSRFTVNWG